MTGAENEDRAPRDKRRLHRGMAAGLDVGFVSLSNLILGLLAAATLSLQDFGAYSVTIIVTTVVVGYSKALTSEPLVLLHSASQRNEQLFRFRQVLAAGLAVGVSSGPLVVGVTVGVLVLAGYPLTGAMRLGLAAALATPLVSLQEIFRGMAYCSGQITFAAANSLVRLVAVPALAIALLTAFHSVESLVMAWGFSALLGAFMGWFLLGRFTPAGGWRWLQHSGFLSRKLVADFTLTLTSGQGAMLLVSVILGVGPIGAIRKAQLVMAPLTLLTTGSISILQPDLVRKAARGVGPLRLRIYAYRVTAGITMLGVGWMALWLLIPTGRAEQLLGDGWDEARGLLAWVTLYATLGALCAMLGIALRALRVVRQQVKARAVLALPTLILVATMASMGPVQALVALSFSLGAVAIIWHSLLSQAARKEIS